MMCSCAVPNCDHLAGQLRPEQPADRQLLAVDQYGVVNRVVDSLHLRRAYSFAPSAWLLGQVEEWKEHFDRQEEKGHYVDLYTQVPELGTFRVKRARSPYAWTLINPELGDIHIWNPDKWASAHKTKTGQLYVDFRSKLLQFEGIDGVWSFMAKLDDVLFDSSVPTLGVNFLLVARADLAVDVQEVADVDWDHLRHFVTRAGLREMYPEAREGDPSGNKVPPTSQNPKTQPPTKGEKYLQEQLAAYLDHMDTHVQVDDDPELFRVIGRRRPQTVYFGKFGQKLYARRYNKLLTLPRQEKLYMLDVWRENGWTEGNPVWRTEFSLSGDFLKETVDPDSGELVDMRPFAKFLNHIRDLWSYLTTRWLRHCETTVDDETHTTRYRTSDMWEVVQGAWAAGIPVGRRRPACRSSADHLLLQAKGCLVTAAAKTAGLDKCREALQQLAFEIRTWANDGDTLLAQYDRRKALGVDDHSELALELLMHDMGLAEPTPDDDTSEWSDTAFSTELRVARLLEGFGS